MKLTGKSDLPLDMMPETSASLDTLDAALNRVQNENETLKQKNKELREALTALEIVTEKLRQQKNSNLVPVTKLDLIISKIAALRMNGKKWILDVLREIRQELS